MSDVGRNSKIRARHSVRNDESNTPHVTATRESRVREQEVSGKKVGHTLRLDPVGHQNYGGGAEFRRAGALADHPRYCNRSHVHWARNIHSSNSIVKHSFRLLRSTMLFHSAQTHADERLSVQAHMRWCLMNGEMSTS